MKEHVSPERLVAFVDGALAEEEAKTVQRHLAECELCRKAVEDLSWLDGRVHEAAPRLEDLSRCVPSPRLAARLQEKAAALMGAERGDAGRVSRAFVDPGASPGWNLRRIDPLRVLLAAVAAGILFFLSLVVFPSRSSPARTGDLLERIHLVRESAYRGEKSLLKARIQAVPTQDLFLYVLYLDGSGRLSLRYPVPGRTEGGRFGPEVPFQGGRLTPIPPLSETGFDLPEAGEDAAFFLVPSPHRLGEEALLRMVDRERKSVESVPGGFHQKKMILLEELKRCFRGTACIEIRK